MRGKISFKVAVIVVAFAIILLVILVFLSLGKEYAEKLKEFFWNMVKGGGNQGH